MQVPHQQHQYAVAIFANFKQRFKKLPNNARILSRVLETRFGSLIMIIKSPKSAKKTRITFYISGPYNSSVVPTSLFWDLKSGCNNVRYLFKFYDRLTCLNPSAVFLRYIPLFVWI